MAFLRLDHGQLLCGPCWAMLSLDRSEGNLAALIMLWCNYVASDEALLPPPVRNDEDHCNCSGEKLCICEGARRAGNACPLL